MNQIELGTSLCNLLDESISKVDLGFYTSVKNIIRKNPNFFDEMYWIVDDGIVIFYEKLGDDIYGN
jgi:hypothetical protein